MSLEHLIRQPSAATFPHWGRLFNFFANVARLWGSTPCFLQSKLFREEFGESAVALLTKVQAVVGLHNGLGLGGEHGGGGYVYELGAGAGGVGSYKADGFVHAFRVSAIGIGGVLGDVRRCADDETGGGRGGFEEGYELLIVGVSLRIRTRVKAAVGAQHNDDDVGALGVYVAVFVVLEIRG